MARFSIGVAIGEAFSLVRRRPLSVFAWGLLMVAPLVASMTLVLPMMAEMFAAMAAGGTGHHDIHDALMTDMMQVQGVSALLNLVQLLLTVVVYTAIMRAVVRPGETAFFSLRLGMDELRVLVVGLAIIVGFYLVALVLVLLGVGVGFGVWGLGEPFNWLIIVAMCVGLMLAIWLGAARVSLIAPASVLTRTFAFEEGWKLGRGRTGALFGLMLLILLIILVTELVVLGVGAAVVAATAGGMDWTQTLEAMESDPFAGLQALFVAHWQWVTIGTVIVSAFYGVLLTLAIAPFASACRQLSTPAAADEAH